MPEYIRALIVILVLASAVFALAKAPATALAMRSEDFVRRRNTWLFLTLAGFLSQNYWVFFLVAAWLIAQANKFESRPVALFFFLLLALPQIRVEVPGFFGVRYLFEVDYLRLLTVVVLLPVCLQARREAVEKKQLPFFADKALLAYLGLSLVLQAQHDLMTNVVRSALYMLVDVLIPYYAITRSVKDLSALRDVLMSFVVGAAVMALVGVFEFVKYWILYGSAGEALGVYWNPGYLSRGAFLRASATSGQSIVIGYVIALALGYFWALRRAVPASAAQAAEGAGRSTTSQRGGRVSGHLVGGVSQDTSTWAAVLAGIFGIFRSLLSFRLSYLVLGALLLAGLLAPLSRGPWVGFAVLVLVLLLNGERWLLRLFYGLGFLLVVAAVLGLAGLGGQVIDYLPFVGSVDNFNVTYRQLLFARSTEIILQNPFFGSSDFLLKMEELRQGQGIIDLVNTFLIVALNTGLVGLGLYCLFFISALLAAYRKARTLAFGTELRELGGAVFAVLLAALVIIATVSPIHHVPILLYSAAAFCLAFSRIETHTDVPVNG